MPGCVGAAGGEPDNDRGEDDLAVIGHTSPVRRLGVAGSRSLGSLFGVWIWNKSNKEGMALGNDPLGSVSRDQQRPAMRRHQNCIWPNKRHFSKCGTLVGTNSCYWGIYLESVRQRGGETHPPCTRLAPNRSGS